MITNSYGNKKFHAATHALMRGPVFFFGAEREGGFVSRLFFMCSHHVLIWFSSGSPSSQVISQDIPNRTSDLSHMIYPKFNSHVYELKT
jgi:hypothetical protein